jgi:hypothetical protein
MSRPDPAEHAPYYGKYVALVPEGDILAAMRSELEQTLALLRDVPDDEALRRHAPYTWSLKEVVGHAQVGQFDRLPLGDLLAEFASVRRSNLSLFANLPEDAWTRTGTANGSAASVRALAYILVGHERHHTTILHRRLSGAAGGASKALP